MPGSSIDPLSGGVGVIGSAGTGLPGAGQWSIIRGERVGWYTPCGYNEEYYAVADDVANNGSDYDDDSCDGDDEDEDQ